MKALYVSAFLLFLLRANGIHIEQNKIGKEINQQINNNISFQPIKKRNIFQRFQKRNIYFSINGKKQSEKNKKELFPQNFNHTDHKNRISFNNLIDPFKNAYHFSYINNTIIKKRRNGTIKTKTKNVNTLRGTTDDHQISLTEKPIIEKVAKNVKGRLNEWIPEFDDNNTLGFFPILLEEMSNEPAPLQIGFEDYLQFNGANVEEIFKNVTRDVIINNKKAKIFGMCFFNHKTGILAPLAVYAEIKDVTKIGNNLAVKGLVRGRIIIDEIIKQEPFILAKISEIEDKKGLIDENESLKIVDEIIRIHTQCTNMESQLMEQMDQSFASMNIKLRNDLKESIDAKLEKFGIDISDPEYRQAFIQIASFCAFDFHLMIVDRYDALMLQNSEDRLRFVRDKIRQKQKQLAIIKNTPREKLQQILEQVQNLKNQQNMPNLPNVPNMPGGGNLKL